MTSDDWRRDRIGSARAGTNPSVLARLPESYAVIGDVQLLPGYCVLLVDDPAITTLTDLPRDRRARYLESMTVLGDAVQRACRDLDPQFRRLNYEILGNTEPFLHTHIFARYEWEDAELVRGPVWWYDRDVFYGPATALGPQHDDLRARITAYLLDAGGERPAAPTT